MKVYESKDIRNVGVVGHGDSGKTTLTAGLLFTAGATNRLLRVDEGNTITDFDEEEIQRKITISTAVAVAEWKKTKINMLDTPGYNIFINDTRASLVAADSALVAGGWRCRRRSPDREGLAVRRTISSSLAPSSLISSIANAPTFERALDNVQEVFGRAAVPIQIPDRRRARLQRRHRPDPHEGLHLHAGWRRQGQGGRNPRRTWRTPRRRRTKRWWRWWPKATTP